MITTITQVNAFDDTLTYNAQINGSGLPIADITDSVITTIDNSNVLTYSNAMGTGRFHQHNDLTAIVGEETYETNQNNNYVQTNYFPIGTTARGGAGQYEPRVAAQFQPGGAQAYLRSRSRPGYCPSSAG